MYGMHDRYLDVLLARESGCGAGLDPQETLKYLSLTLGSQAADGSPLHSMQTSPEQHLQAEIDTLRGHVLRLTSKLNDIQDDAEVADDSIVATDVAFVKDGASFNARTVCYAGTESATDSFCTASSSRDQSHSGGPEEVLAADDSACIDMSPGTTQIDTPLLGIRTLNSLQHATNQQQVGLARAASAVLQPKAAFRNTSNAIDRHDRKLLQLQAHVQAPRHNSHQAQPRGSPSTAAVTASPAVTCDGADALAAPSGSLEAMQALQVQQLSAWVRQLRAERQQLEERLLMSSGAADSSGGGCSSAADAACEAARVLRNNLEVDVADLGLQKQVLEQEVGSLQVADAALTHHVTELQQRADKYKRRAGESEAARATLHAAAQQLQGQVEALTVQLTSTQEQLYKSNGERDQFEKESQLLQAAQRSHDELRSGLQARLQAACAKAEDAANDREQLLMLLRAEHRRMSDQSQALQVAQARAKQAAARHQEELRRLEAQLTQQLTQQVGCVGNLMWARSQMVKFHG